MMPQTHTIIGTSLRKMATWNICGVEFSHISWAFAVRMNPMSTSFFLLSPLTVFLACTMPVTFAGSGSTFTFPSEDGLEVTADLYAPEGIEDRPVIVLFHQARFSRGAYCDTAPRLNALGFACIAVDQRSGDRVNGVVNETARRASAAGLGTEFEDALPDMRAALAYARSANGGAAVIGIGSSYSSSLIIKIAADNPDLVDGTLSFSPGEYFSDRKLIQTAAANVNIPAFITSARSERNVWPVIFDAIGSQEKVSFVPESAGRHGASTLWPTTANNEETWSAVEAFLAQWINTAGEGTAIAIDREAGEITATFGSSGGMVIETSRDLDSWIAVASTDDVGEITVPASRGGSYFRSSKAVTAGGGDVTAVETTGSAGSYSFRVTISSPDTGCEQYADWWEVLGEDGELLYRRVLLHSHVAENPFTRSGSPVPVDPDTTVWVRAHMNNSGYGGMAMKGSVASGFEQAALPANFAPGVATQSPLPDGCNF